MHLQTLQRRLALAVAENPSATHVAVPISAVRGIIKDLKRDGAPADVVILPVVEAAPVAPKAKPVKLPKLPKLLADVPYYGDWLGVRARRVLMENRVRLTSQLQALTEADLRSFAGMGPKSANEVLEWAKQQGVHRG